MPSLQMMSVEHDAALILQDAIGSDDENEALVGTGAVSRATFRRMSSATATYSTLVASRRLKLSRPEPPAQTLRSYEVEPAISFAHNGSVNAIAFPHGARHAYTAGNDGFIRRFDIYDGLNGIDASSRSLHMKSGANSGDLPGGILTGYWAGSEWLEAGATGPPNGRYNPAQVKFGSRSVTTGVEAPAAVHSLAIQSEELWGLSGTDKGEMSLFGVRLDEGQIRHVMRASDRAHSADAAVNSLSLIGRETAVISAGSDRKILHWDLNTGRIVRRYGDATRLPSAPVTSLAVRPMTTELAPSPPPASEDPMDIDAPGQTGPFGSNNANSAAPGVELGEESEKGSDDSDAELDRRLSDDAFLTASSDGSTTVWDRRSTKPIWRIKADKAAPSWALNVQIGRAHV